MSHSLKCEVGGNSPFTSRQNRGLSVSPEVSSFAWKSEGREGHPATWWQCADCACVTVFGLSFLFAQAENARVLPEDQMQHLIIAHLRTCPTGPPRGKLAADSACWGVRDLLDKNGQKASQWSTSHSRIQRNIPWEKSSALNILLATPQARHRMGLQSQLGVRAVCTKMGDKARYTTLPPSLFHAVSCQEAVTGRWSVD